MKCPYPDCRKDYNDENWPKAMSKWISPPDTSGSIAERQFYNRLFVVSRKCRFCGQLFHDVYVGHENFKDHTESFQEIEPTLEPLATYPISKTKFEAKNIPKKVIDAFNESERCRSVGSLTGVGGCLRKAIYAVCDDKQSTGRDYREKIGNLGVKEAYKELLKQIKWLGDNTTKPGEEKYTMDMVDVGLEILPVIIDDLYLKDEKMEDAAKLLARARSVNLVEEQEEK
jgi:hypothetical protein